MFISIQKLMSKGLGLVVFGGLLVFVIISFVTFTDSGQSLWDEVFPGGQREKMEFFEHDLNDNEQMRSLYARNRVACRLRFFRRARRRSHGKSGRNFSPIYERRVAKGLCVEFPRKSTELSCSIFFRPSNLGPTNPSGSRFDGLPCRAFMTQNLPKLRFSPNWLWMPKRMRGDFFPSGTTLRTPTSIFPVVGFH